MELAAIWNLICLVLIFFIHPISFSIWGPRNLASVVVVLVAYLLLGIPYLKRPQLAYVLPFKALRLSVIETNSGIPLFTHTWNAGLSMADEDLFSGMVQGVSMIVKESVGRGDIRIVELDQGILILQRLPKSPIACVLVSTKASKVLRQALVQFSSRFIEMFGNSIQNPTKVSQFNSASDLVEECFLFLPDYA